MVLKIEIKFCAKSNRTALSTKICIRQRERGKRTAIDMRERENPVMVCVCVHVCVSECVCVCVCAEGRMRCIRLVRIVSINFAALQHPNKKIREFNDPKQKKSQKESLKKLF